MIFCLGFVLGAALIRMIWDIREPDKTDLERQIVKQDLELQLWRGWGEMLHVDFVPPEW